MALASGATFAGYIVARRLGSGMTGDVYLVQDRQSERWAALKVLSLAWSSNMRASSEWIASSPTITCRKAKVYRTRWPS